MFYQIQVALDPQFTQIVVNEIVENVTEYNVQDKLDYFTVYYWRVKSIDPMTGAESDWSATCAFRVIAEDVTITTNIDNSYYLYGSNCFGLYHRFVTSDEVECVIPNAIIGAGLCQPTSAVAQLGVCFCTGVVRPVWDGRVFEYLLTENNEIIQTEDGTPILLEF
jgi:hypothetical protein